MVPKNGLFAVVLVLDGVNGAAWPAGQRVLKFGILAETTGITQKRVLNRRKSFKNHFINKYVEK